VQNSRTADSQPLWLLWAPRLTALMTARADADAVTASRMTRDLHA